MTDQKMHEIIVVGAGPVGLSLALGLARQNHDVLIIEKDDSTVEHSRAPAIWPGTQEIMADLGVVDTFLDNGIVMDNIELRDVDRNSTLLTFPLEELKSETSYPHLLVLPQSQTEKILLNALQQESTANILFSSNVVKLTQHPSKVEVQYEGPDGRFFAHAKYVAGCDGAHSTVRDNINASLEGTTYKLQAALADVEIENSLDLPFPRLTTRPRFAISLRIRQNIWRMILPFAGKDDVPLTQRVEDAANSLFDGRPFRPVWQNEFRLHRQISSSFTDGRIVLAGDAAHLNSPVGGQGMNVGIQDAAILVRIIAEALDQSKSNPFEEYGRKRPKEIQQGVNRFTDTLTRILLFGEGRMIRPVLASTNVLMHIPYIRRRVMRRLAFFE